MNDARGRVEEWAIAWRTAMNRMIYPSYAVWLRLTIIGRRNAVDGFAAVVERG